LLSKLSLPCAASIENAPLLVLEGYRRQTSGRGPCAGRDGHHHDGNHQGYDDADHARSVGSGSAARRRLLAGRRSAAIASAAIRPESATIGTPPPGWTLAPT
jgi:hypothetical protein